MLAAVRAIVPPQPDEEEVQEWERAALERALDAAESMTLGLQDGELVASYCIEYRDVDCIQTR